MTIRQLAAARQSRLWDKQAATYVDAIRDDLGNRLRSLGLEPD